MHPIRVAAIAALAAITASSTALGREASGDAATMAMYQAALLSAEQGEPARVIDALEPALDPALYETMSSARRYDIARLYAEAAGRVGDWPKAHRGLVLATGGARADDADWAFRFVAAIRAGEGPDTYATLLRLERNGQPILANLDDGDMGRLDYLLRRLPDPQARLALGRQMEREGWQPLHASDDPSLFWLHYTEALLVAGDRERAAAAAGHIVDPMVIMAMHADRRFDGVIAANPSLRDPRAAAEQSLAAAQAYMRGNPRLLAGRIAVARALAVLRRPTEALPLLDDATRALAVSSRTRPPFDDLELLDDIEAWRTSALIGAGRAEEAIGARISRAACRCVPWASLNVARALLQAGRPREALRWTEDVGAPGDPRLRIDTAQVAACAASELKDAAIAARSIAYLKDNARSAPEALATALVCAERFDEASAILVQQVADPATRLATLSRLQAFAAAEPEQGFGEKMRGRWAHVLAGPALRAQIDQVGRLNHFSLAQFASVS